MESREIDSEVVRLGFVMRVKIDRVSFSLISEISEMIVVIFV